MNKNRSVRVPVTEKMLKELRRKAQTEDVNVTDMTRWFWNEWIAGKFDRELKRQSEAA